ncbi:MAG: OST3/OST6 family protein [Candidatus Bathyarchaeota archaeon]|nr:OST3/OST6 family protein [Candidatus Bathyarchaeota archaeon]
MSGKIKKSSEEMSFSLSRWIRRVTTNAPAITVVTIVGLCYAVFLFGGGLYLLIEQPIPSYYNSQTGTFYFLYPSLSYQFGADTIIAIALYAMGFVGLMAIYQSAKNASKPRQAYMLLLIGVTFVLLSYLFLESAILAKSG